MSSQAGAALLRIAALGIAAVLVGVVLAVLAAGAGSPDENTGIATLQVAAFFFAPLAAIAALASIIVLALTRPASLQHRLRAARYVAAAYVLASVGLTILLSSLWWALLVAGASAIAAAIAWWLLRPEASNPT